MEEQKESPATAVSRNILALGLVSFFTDISSEMVYSLLPAFILGLPGSGRAILGTIEGLAEALSYDMRAVSGIFSDKFRKRKALILVGYGLSNAVKPLFAVAQTAFDALTIRVTDRVGKGVRTAPRDALLSESVSEEQRGAAFGLHRTLDQTGAIIGPLIASGAMYLLGLTARDVFWISFIPGLAALLVLLFLVKEKTGKPSGEFRLLREVRKVLNGRFTFLLVVVGLFSLGAFSYWPVITNATDAGVDLRVVPTFYAMVNLTHTLVAIPSGVLSDRVGKEHVLAMGYGAFFATALLLLLWPGNYYFAVLIALTFGIYEGIVNTVARALVPKYSESALRGTAYGLYYLVVGTCALISNTAVGTLWEHYGSSTAAMYSLALSSLGIVGMLLFILTQRRKP